MTTYQFPMFERLEPVTPWQIGRVADTDVLSLDDAAYFASKQAGTEIRPADFLRAASRGEIPLRAIVHHGAKLKKHDGGIYCNEGTAMENIVPEGTIPTLPLSACQCLSSVGRASWRTIDGFDSIDGELMRFPVATLEDGEPDFETVPTDCRVMGWDARALADAYLDNRETLPTAPTGTQEKQDASGVDRSDKPNVTVHKLRQNSLDAPIRKAMENAKSRSVGTVFVHLRELALNGEIPFTGAFEGAAICYTNDDGEPAKLSKDALRKRIENL